MGVVGLVGRRHLQADAAVQGDLDGIDGHAGRVAGNGAGAVCREGTAATATTAARLEAPEAAADQAADVHVVVLQPDVL